MVEMVHDRIAAGETTVVSTAAVLLCGKQMEKVPHYNFSWTVSLQNFEEAMDLSQDRVILEYTTHKDMSNRPTYIIEIRKPEGKRLLCRPWSRWEAIINTDSRHTMCTVLNCLWIGSTGVILWASQYTLWFQNRRGSSWPAWRLSAFIEGLCSMD
jgi:hypothetical protein